MKTRSRGSVVNTTSIFCYGIVFLDAVVSIRNYNISVILFKPALTSCIPTSEANVKKPQRDRTSRSP